jgi:hypothetical protein
MYRIMFYTKLFPCDRYSFKDFVDLGDDAIKLIQRQRTAVLKEYPTDELRQMYAVIQFLRGILEDVAEAENDIAIGMSSPRKLISPPYSCVQNRVKHGRYPPLAWPRICVVHMARALL